MLGAMSAGEERDGELALRKRDSRRPCASHVLSIGLIGLFVLLAAAQLLLPRIAAKVLRDRVAKYGEVRSVSVSAVPAVELLWGSAGSARVDAGRLGISPHQLAKLLAESKAVSKLTVRASDVALRDPGLGARSLSFTDASLEKHGDAIEIRALLDVSALRAALPPGVNVEVLSSGGQGVQVRVTGQLLGFGASLRAVVYASEGKLLLKPAGTPLAGLAAITLFSDPRIEMRSVSARAVESADGHRGPPRAWLLQVKAKLH